MSCDVKEDKKSKCIILNKMFSGKYLMMGENIGHEIINMYKADDDNVYLYLNPSGNIPQSRLCDEMYMLMVRKYSIPHVLQVIAFVKIDSIVKGAAESDSKKGIEEQNKNLTIKYGDVSAFDIMKNNVLEGHDGANYLATFKADVESTRIPKQILLIGDLSCDYEKYSWVKKVNTKFPSENLRAYYCEGSDSTDDAFSDLIKLYDNSDLWFFSKDKPFFQKISSSDMSITPDKTNILRLSGNEDDELTFSNLLYYFLSDREMSNAFFSKLGVTDFELESIEREEYKIDLLLRGTCSGRKCFIAIENKIHSAINGKLMNQVPVNEKQETIQDWIRECKNRVEVAPESVEGKTISQLTKYYIYVKSQEKEEEREGSLFFIFCPNYANKHMIEKDEHLYGDEYHIVNYDKIHKFFMQCAIPKAFENDHNYSFYLQEFRDALEKHTKEVDDSLELEMDRRFRNAIVRLRNQQRPI